MGDDTIVGAIQESGSCCSCHSNQCDCENESRKEYRSDNVDEYSRCALAHDRYADTNRNKGIEEDENRHQNAGFGVTLAAHPTNPIKDRSIPSIATRTTAL